MCGIAGMLNFDGAPASPVRLASMTDAIAHRGPDDEGQFVDGAFGLGHRRLSIIDLSPAGHQPMATHDGRFVLSYNGEVYNFKELRIELEAQGHQFHSRTDSEVVLHAWVEWDADSLERLNGMFAFAVWDRQERTLVLARDRYGIKPLHYVQVGDVLLFGSEIKALLAHGAYRATVDEQALAEYLTFQNLFTSRSLFAGVRTLPAGHFLRVGSDDRHAPPPRRYWDFTFREPEDAAAPREYKEELDRLFCQAVNRQLIADVPIGSYLSGGMDSGSITAIASGQLANMRTFTVGFDLNSASGMELGFDERAASERLSYMCRTEHYEMVLKAGDMERVMPRLIRQLEEPRVGQCYPNFYAAQLAGKFDKVVLSGAGGDELFGGYPWRYYRAAVNDGFDDYADKYFRFWQRVLPETALPEVLRPVWEVACQASPRQIFRDVFDHHVGPLTRPEDYINHSLYLEAKTFLHGLLLVEDKLSMAHSLETRLPFLDNDLVEFAQRVPVNLKLGNLGEVVRIDENDAGPKVQHFFEKTKDGKLILREAMRRYVPDEVASRIKQGFSAPDASWYRGESIEYVRKRLLDPLSPMYEYLDHNAVRRHVERHISGQENLRLLIWSFLSLEEWFRAFVSREEAAESRQRTPLLSTPSPAWSP